VQAEWRNRYATMDFSSEAAIVEEIGRFLLNGKLYRGLRPVMWSPVEKTALAEAEIEYHDHTSTTILVAFPVVKDPTPAHALADVSVVIWTTTPWTIPGNRALAYGPEITYVVLRVDETGEGALLEPGAKRAGGRSPCRVLLHRSTCDGAPHSLHLARQCAGGCGMRPSAAWGRV
jgi:isoleucyl-tRNA synthetase